MNTEALGSQQEQDENNKQDITFGWVPNSPTFSVTVSLDALATTLCYVDKTQVIGREE